MEFISLILYMIFIVVIIYIGQVALVLFITLWILKTNSINKVFKIILIAIISLCVIFMLYNYKNETIDDLYIEMNEMVDNKSLIGLSEEEVVELLGEPRYQYTDRENKENYKYSAGKIFKEWFWGKCYSTKYYELRLDFDESGKVEYAYIKECT